MAEIIIPGEVKSIKNDYMCHKQLGGCGCVFLSDKIITRTNYEGDTIESYIVCPSCTRKVLVREWTGMLQYGRVMVDKKFGMN